MGKENREEEYWLRETASEGTMPRDHFIMSKAAHHHWTCHRGGKEMSCLTAAWGLPKFSGMRARGPAKSCKGVADLIGFT